jgi:hypothetical protein
MSIKIVYYLRPTALRLWHAGSLTSSFLDSAGGVGGTTLDAMRARSVHLGTMAQKPPEQVLRRVCERSVGIYVGPKSFACGDKAASNNLARSRTALGERAQQPRGK